MDQILIAGSLTGKGVRNVYKKADGVKERIESEKLLLYNINTRELILLEDLGRAVWDLLSDMPLEEIESLLLSYHPDEKEKIESYLGKFIDDLVNKKFLVRDI
jgi:hypothetical protein